MNISASYQFSSAIFHCAKVIVIQYGSSHRGCSVKKVLLKISQSSQENTCARVSFLIKLQACNFIKKETLAQVFSCGFWEISKNTFFTEDLWTTASEDTRLEVVEGLLMFLYRA